MSSPYCSFSARHGSTSSRRTIPCQLVSMCWFLYTPRIVSQQHKNIRVPPIRQRRRRLAAKLLRQRAEPPLCALIRRIVAIESRRAKRTIAPRHQHIRLTKSTLNTRLGTHFFRPIVAVREETLGKVTPTSNHLTELPTRPRCQRRLRIPAKAPRSRAQLQRKPVRSFRGREIHDTAQRIRSVQRRPRPMQHIRSTQRIHRHRHIEVEVRRLGIVDAQPVQQHQRLFIPATANGQVILHTATAALLHIHRSVAPQHLADAVHRKPLQDSNSSGTVARCDCPSVTGSSSPTTVTVSRTVVCARKLHRTTPPINPSKQPSSHTKSFGQRPQISSHSRALKR